MANATIEAGAVLLNDDNQRGMLFCEQGNVTGWDFPSAEAPPDDSGFGYTLINVEDGVIDMTEQASKGVGCKFEEFANDFITTEDMLHEYGLLLTPNFQNLRREIIIIIHNRVAVEDIIGAFVEVMIHGQNGLMWEDSFDLDEAIVVTNS